MPDELARIQARVRRVNRRLDERKADPSNADRAIWGDLAVLTFAKATGQSADVRIDPETILGDLIADLMHWCDREKSNPDRVELLDFESALGRARNHYEEEVQIEQNGTTVERRIAPYPREYKDKLI
jgi:hypothetical protein